MKINKKPQFAQMYKRGLFGNRSPTWDSVTDWANDPEGHGTGAWNGSRKFHLRNRRAGGDTYYDLTANMLLHQITRLKDPIGNYYVSEMAPTPKTIIQGEVGETLRYPNQRGSLCLTYTKVKKPMRDALAEQTLHSFGMEANCILRRYLDCYDWVIDLIKEYPGHTIEFSVYSVPFGTLNWKTVIWEVRNY